MSLLPPNATKFEKAVEQSIKYNVDPKILAGFKFNQPSSKILLSLSWEYSLAQIKVDDFKDRILQGLQFHRLKGTPYALRMAFSWHGFNNIKIEEEEPGEHFAEFQIGVETIPNDLDVPTVVNVAALAAPLRSRLSRMYNDLYDIRRFKLDESPWGDLLSDYSGQRPYDGAPKFSFGRVNNYMLSATNVVSNFSVDRDSYAFAVNLDTYRLDWAILDETGPGLINYGMFGASHRYIFNSDFIGDKVGKIFEERKIAKALCVLSDDAILDDINSCFSCGTVLYEGDDFSLDYNYLSETSMAASYGLIACRNWRENQFEGAYTFKPCADRGYNAHYRVFMTSAALEARCSRTTERHTVANYPGNDLWHDQAHFDVAWSEQRNHPGVIASSRESL